MKRALADNRPSKYCVLMLVHTQEVEKDGLAPLIFLREASLCFGGVQKFSPEKSFSHTSDLRGVLLGLWSWDWGIVPLK